MRDTFPPPPPEGFTDYNIDGSWWDEDYEREQPAACARWRRQREKEIFGKMEPVNMCDIADAIRNFRR